LWLVDRIASGPSVNFLDALKEGSMRHIANFVLQIQPATPTTPTHVSIALIGAPPDQTGNIPLSPDCMTLDELEGAINGLQDELDLLRAEARRAFADQVGHG
jgi:hypothetical protein